MKRFSALIFALVMLMSFAGCSGKNKSAVPSTDSATLSEDELKNYVGEALKTHLISLVKNELVKTSTAKYDLDGIEITVTAKEDDKIEYKAKTTDLNTEKSKTFKCVAVESENGWVLESIE